MLSPVLHKPFGSEEPSTSLPSCVGRTGAGGGGGVVSAGVPRSGQAQSWGQGGEGQVTAGALG